MLEYVTVFVNGPYTPSQSFFSDTGYDLKYHGTDNLIIQPGKIAKVPTGIRVSAVESGLDIQVRSRSGLSSQGLFVINSPGTIDEDYTGEICVLLANFSGREAVIEPNTRIAQLVVAPRFAVVWTPVDASKLPETVRNADGFGSTGNQ